MEKSVTIIEDWNERDGRIYYRWKLIDEKEWHEELTPYKQKPIIQYKYLSPFEYKNFYRPAQTIKQGEE